MSALALPENPRLAIGNNNPPEPTPFEIAEKAVNDAYEEAVLWLDGHVIDSQKLADGVGNLLTTIRKAEKLADDTRKAEKAELDTKIAEIQARYAPLIADTKTVKGKTVLAATACKQALQPWLDKEARRVAEEARVAREEAERQRREAEAALQASSADNLAERARAEELLSEAKKADRTANAAERVTATAGGSFGKSIALRTVYTVTVTNEVAAARHVWMSARPEMLEFLTGWAERQVRLGLRDLPGFTVSKSSIAA